MEHAYLRMENITKSFPGVKALQNVCFNADEGEVVALLGENGAGKSTLMNVLGGIIQKDEGKIFINNSEVSIKSVHEAQLQGISFIHQELSLFPMLSVQENLFIDGFIKKKHSVFLNNKEMKKKSEEIIDTFGLDINPDTKVMNLSMGEQQLVEIASAVLKDSKILILDEPTTSLTERECVKLFQIVKQLRERKKIIVLITHDIERALKESDRVFVQKDGKNVGTGLSSQLTKEDVIQMMIGDKAGKRFMKNARKIDEEAILKFDRVSTKKLKDVSFELRKGEVLGMYGLIGSGRTEIIHALFGLDRIISGTVWLKGTRLEKPNPGKMIGEKVAYLTENRRDEGLFLEHGVNKNISISNLKEICSKILGVIDRKKELDITNTYIEKLSIAVPNAYQLVGKLSGGNQQKVVIGKWLNTNPEIFILDEPTRGIDVGAKSEIYAIIDDIARHGVSVILISSEIEEILGMSDRVLVMANGSVSGELEADEITRSNIVKYTMA